jgi:hypothetical protein
MFDHYCPACEKRQLLFGSQITRIVNDEQGIVVLLTCWCGEPAAVRTGKATGTDAASAPAHALVG